MLQFSKYQGTGNDFVITDNRATKTTYTTQQIAHICHRKTGIGADGFITLEQHTTYDFEMKYYNADGNESTMCGNGGRCLVQFAYDIGIKKETYNFIAIDGSHTATIADNGWVHLQMTPVHTVTTIGQHYILNTGSPHYIVPDNDVEHTNVTVAGKQIRYNATFAEQGINVNFVQLLNSDSIFVRTYERGVEDETLSCGTGVTAAALVHAHNDRGFNVINIKTLGGKLRVEFDKLDDQTYENIWLCGPATKVYGGIINL